VSAEPVLNMTPMLCLDRFLGVMSVIQITLAEINYVDLKRY